MSKKTIKRVAADKRIDQMEHFIRQYKEIFDKYLANAEAIPGYGFVEDPILTTVFMPLFHSMPEEEQTYFHEEFEENIHPLVLFDYDDY